MGEYPILEGYSANFQQLSMRPFDLRSKGYQQPVSWSRLPRPSRRSCGRALGDLTRWVRLSDVWHVIHSHHLVTHTTTRLAISVFFYSSLSLSSYSLRPII